ncbi:DapH/DapD/GlmU-related protein [Streptococcus oricebi]|uniref:Exopolysaccharide biosynthesis protein n=1 Tax=Streptococcus oricebi TaxID=1547447 RepID=A0ABS5B3W1_9STRE|nr:DapH/DapD/GlmU-related protein [Streptococcus oricebi]MBP2622669.1 exopolysaccharide biosynthesis protein [Streptococcus oricebi]
MDRINFTGSFHSIDIAPSSQLEIGEGVTFKSFTSLEVAGGASLNLGKRVFFNDHCTLRCMHKIEIGKDTMFGDGVRLFDHNHRYSNYHIEKIAHNTAPISIGKDCWIGANSVILAGVTIGDNVVIGANSLIYRDIPSNSIVMSREDLIIKERPQATYHAFTLTASDTLEHLAYLAQELPNLEFHIAAKTSISPYLESFERFPNITLHTNIHQEDIIEDLLDQADIYLDINHWGEVDQIVERALAARKPVFTFEGLAHQSSSEQEVFPQSQPEKMLAAIKRHLNKL